MAAVLRKTQDSAGGIITGGSDNVFINGYGAVRVDDTVTSHGTGNHASATMNEGSSTVFVNGKALCRVGDKASCNHSSTGGSSDVFSG